MYELLSQAVKKLNGRISIVPVDMIKTLENDVIKTRNGEYGSNLINLIINDFFSFQLPYLPFVARSIMIVATPSPYVMVTFNWKGRQLSFPNESFLPYTSNADRLEKALRDELSLHGYHVQETGQLPMKPLAVRSGLGLYGRNNVVYVDGLGSFITLKAFFSDVSCDDDKRQDLKRMGMCEHCSLCLGSCPTGAIKKDRHIIKAEECLTYLNEFIDAEGFPDWLSASAHNSLHGCIVCQAICPINKPFIKNIEAPVEFDEYETQKLLKGVCLDELSQETADKIMLLSLEEYLPLLPRNLSALLAKEA